MFDIKKVLVLFSLVLLLGTIYAETTMIDELFSNPENAKEQYNSNLDSIPGSLRKFLGNEKIQLNVDYGTEIKTITIVFKEGAIDSYALDDSISPTLKVDTDKETMNKIIESNNKVQDFKDAIRDKKLKYNAVGVFKEIKFGFARFILKFVK